MIPTALIVDISIRVSIVAASVGKRGELTRMTGGTPLA